MAIIHDHRAWAEDLFLLFDVHFEGLFHCIYSSPAKAVLGPLPLHFCPTEAPKSRKLLAVPFVGKEPPPPRLSSLLHRGTEREAP